MTRVRNSSHRLIDASLKVLTLDALKARLEKRITFCMCEIAELFIQLSGLVEDAMHLVKGLDVSIPL
jgi:hypothetical protein